MFQRNILTNIMGNMLVQLVSSCSSIAYIKRETDPSPGIKMGVRGNRKGREFSMSRGTMWEKRSQGEMDGG